jgi:hypothetical protein
MREIKFRARDCGNKKWRTVNDVVGIDNDGCLYPAMLKTQRGETTNPDLVVMQYTGLKDKNGKEIYEGDILDGSTLFGRGIVKPHTLNPARIVVVHEDLSHNYSFSDLIEGEWEIIGNVYENPNLLTNEK